MEHRPLAALALASLLSCATNRAEESALQLPDDAEAEEPRDPTQLEVPLPTLAEGWDASLVLDDDVGVWTVKAFDVFEPFGAPEVVALDDRGVCHVLAGYSGKWTSLPRVHDMHWLGGLDFADVDPRFDGSELYTAGASGNVYQLVAYPHVAMDCRLIGYLPGREVYTLVAGELDPRSPGAELLAFTKPGALFRLSPTGADGRFETTLLETYTGRVRDAVQLPEEPGRPRELAVLSRAGWLRIVHIDEAGVHWESIHEEPMGMGRLCLGPVAPGRPVVLYSTLDDGRVQRHERGADRSWKTETIYAGPQGARGVAAGRFFEDPVIEGVAVFGYGRKVQLLKRTAKGWTAEDVFEDLDKGHWISVLEADGRNATDELVGSGYAGRVFLLSRPPGYGLAGAATAPEQERASEKAKEN